MFKTNSRQALLALVLLFAAISRAAAQQPTDTELPVPPEAIKRWGLTEVPPGHYARELMDRVCAAAKYRGPRVRVFVGESKEIANAHAFICNLEGTVLTPEGPRHLYIPMVMYNASFMTRYAFTAGNEYVALGILAHELGHIIHRHPDVTNPLASNQHPWEQEIEADEFAGAVMARLGATPEDVARTYRMMCVEHWVQVKKVDGQTIIAFGDTGKETRVGSLTKGSKTHPDIVRRIQAVGRGYLRGGGTGDVETNLHAIFRDLTTEVVRWEMNDKRQRME